MPNEKRKKLRIEWGQLTVATGRKRKAVPSKGLLPITRIKRIKNNAAGRLKRKYEFVGEKGGKRFEHWLINLSKKLKYPTVACHSNCDVAINIGQCRIDKPEDM